MDRSIDFIKPLLSKCFWIPASLFILNQILEKLNWSHWWLRSYLDDILVLLVILPVIEVLMRLVTRNRFFKLDLPMVITAFLMLVVIFEWMLPNLSNRYTSDLWDVLCYAIGMFVYLLCNNKIGMKKPGF
jgi:hypothetical protein